MEDGRSTKRTEWRAMLALATTLALSGPVAAAPVTPGWGYVSSNPPQAVPENQIRAHVESPARLIEPGGTGEFTVILENPEDSGRVVIAIEYGGFYSSSSSYSGTDSIEEGTGVWRLYPSDVITPVGACESDSCLEEGQLPLSPGASASLTFLKAEIPQDATTQNYFHLGRGYLSLITADADDRERGRRRIELFLDSDIHVGVSDGKTGPPLPDPSSLESEYAGHAAGDVIVTLHHPGTFPAGVPFPVTATVTNTGETTLHSVRLQPGTRDPFESPRYQWVRECLRCRISGQPHLEPGESMTLALGSYYPQDNEYQAGTFTVSPPEVHLVESGSRVQTLFLDEPSLTVELTGPETPQPRPDANLPERMPLVFGDTVLHDPNTGNDWLPLGSTAGLDTDGLEDAMATGEVPSSFRVASLSEVETLLLNHLQSKGLNLRRHHLYGEIDHITLEVIRQMKHWLSGSAEPSDSVLLTPFLGITNDPADLLSTGGQWATDLLSSRPGQLGIRYYQPFLTPFGMMRLPVDHENPPSQMLGSVGWWLVRSPEAPPARPIDRASFHDRLLVIPAVEESGTQYRAVLEMMDPVSGRLRAVSLEPLEEPMQDASRFDPATGTIELPRAMVFWPDGAETVHDATLTLVPGSSPPIFHVSGDF